MAVASELNPVNVGIDVGQVNDPMAVCVTEVTQVDTGKLRYASEQTLGHHDPKGFWVPPTGIDPVMRSEYIVRYITRLPLGMPYPDVAEHIADMLCNDLFQNRIVRVLIDITGVGRPVWQDLQKEIRLRPKCKHIRIKPTSFVRGEQYNRSKGSLGKSFLVSRTQSLLQGERIHGPDIPEMRATCEELRIYEIKTSEEGKNTYGAFKVGTHDDLATALGLSCLEDPYSEKVSYSGRIY
jgi:hypothetical protein